jgi:hypothetical protein
MGFPLNSFRVFTDEMLRNAVIPFLRRESIVVAVGTALTSGPLEFLHLSSSGGGLN